MNDLDRVNILLVDDQPGKLLSYESILGELEEVLIRATSPKEAFRQLLKHDIAVILMDVSMPEMDGFQLAKMIRDHPRFRQTAIIFVSAINLTNSDFVRGYQLGGVDYVTVPVIPEVLRAKVRVFADLYRKTRALEQVNANLERMVRERTNELAAVAQRLTDSEKRRNLALAAGRMGAWEWDRLTNEVFWDPAQCRIAGVDAEHFAPTLAALRELCHPEDWPRIERLLMELGPATLTSSTEFRIRRPDGEERWCLGTAAVAVDDSDRVVKLSGVTIDITDRKAVELRQELLAREVDHRARNALAVVQAILRLSTGDTITDYRAAAEGRIHALARAHTLLAQSRWHGADLRKIVTDELAPMQADDRITIEGEPITVEPGIAQSISLVVHELATNAAKYGALARPGGRVLLRWHPCRSGIELSWTERGGRKPKRPSRKGFGLQLIKSCIGAMPGGEVDISWEREGAICRFVIPLSHERRNSAAAGTAEQQNPAGTTPNRRVLIVEDEALVAMMLHDIVVGMGCTVHGPFGTLPEALAAARTAEVDAAILDITLGRDDCYPVAELLAERAIPFAFVTGYGADGIDERFSTAPVYQKPVGWQEIAVFLGELETGGLREPLR